MAKGKVLYIGGFELPDKNAAAQRVLSVGKALREIGYKVFYLGITHDGVINGEVVGTSVISEYASIPSMEGLLTMLAGGMIEHVKNLSIALNLYAEGLEK